MTERQVPRYPGKNWQRPAAPATIIVADSYLSDYKGEKLTEVEIAAVRSVTGDFIDMKSLPVNSDDVPRIPYRQYVYKENTSRHYGQRKLLLSEVDFLLNHARMRDTIVYAGAAPGVHIPYLAMLFSRLELKFILIDPRPFELSDTTNIEMRQTFFTEKSVAEFAGRDDVLFISDIRSGVDEFAVPSEELVKCDMEMQKEWVLAMNPRAVSLKYRLGYSEESAEYIAGAVRIQAWAPSSSTETRLEARRPYQQVATDSRDHEERMVYVNKILREWAAYDHGVPLHMVRGLDQGFDSATEVRIWRRYLAQMGSPAAIRPSRKDFHYRYAADATEIASLINHASIALRRSLAWPARPARQHLLQPQSPN